ncbi:MAG: formate dehydrogenase [Alphaproteobacteria bacterium]|nr:MAG: formate dehydrogenase [Alphaproteobacteria bacterium]
MTVAELVRMANQIAAFNAAYPRDEAIRGMEEHIRAFWEPRMRRMMAEHLAAGGEGLTELAREGAARACGIIQRA